MFLLLICRNPLIIKIFKKKKKSITAYATSRYKYIVARQITFGYRLDIYVVAKVNINRGFLIFKYHVLFELFYDEDSMEGKKWHRGWTRGHQSAETNEKKGLSRDLFHQRCMRRKKVSPELSSKGVASISPERVVQIEVVDLLLPAMSLMSNVYSVLSVSIIQFENGGLFRIFFFWNANNIIQIDFARKERFWWSI